MNPFWISLWISKIIVMDDYLWRETKCELLFIIKNLKKNKWRNCTVKIYVNSL